MRKEIEKTEEIIIDRNFHQFTDQYGNFLLPLPKNDHLYTEEELIRWFEKNEKSSAAYE